MLGDHLFIKDVPLIEGETYPDFGSNFETFTNAEFLELETIGPLKRISEGETIEHKETWAIVNGIDLPNVRDEEAFLNSFESYKKLLVEA